MKNKYLNYIIIAILALTLIVTEVSASSINFNNIDDRINHNIKMKNSSSSTTYQSVERYKDKYLKDLSSTKYEGITSAQQTKIQNFVDNVVLNGEKDTLTNEEKIKKIYDWIVENYYYYNSPYAISSLGSNCDNPYYLLKYEYDINRKVRARSNGFASTFIAFVRTQGISAKLVGGYYKPESINDSVWPNNITVSNMNRYFAQVYTNNAWKIVEPSTETSNYYDDLTSEYKTNANKDLMEKVNYNYYAPTMNNLSKTHFILKYYPGSTGVKYLSNSYEKTKITTFLNKIYYSKKNGKRINANYNTSSPQTWFVQGTSSRGDGAGQIKQIYWPAYKNLAGTLDLSGFRSLQTLSVTNNKITNLYLINSPSIKTVTVSSNKMRNIIVTGSSNLKYLKAFYNPATYIKYNYGKTKRTAILKTTTGGNIGVKYIVTSSGKHKHELRAQAKSGYKFIGWYKGTSRISKNKNVSIYRTQSFTYTAKFIKVPKAYIYVSIKNQKLYYYKNGKLVLSTRVVTGQKGSHDTPKGNFKILSKAKNVELIGPDYRTRVDYWILINRKHQIGLHDASWRWEFGGSIYKYNGSHGCVNMPYSKAQYIYNYVKIGTPVTIK